MHRHGAGGLASAPTPFSFHSIAPPYFSSALRKWKSLHRILNKMSSFSSPDSTLTSLRSLYLDSHVAVTSSSPAPSAAGSGAGSGAGAGSSAMARRLGLARAPARSLRSGLVPGVVPGSKVQALDLQRSVLHRGAQRLN